MNEGLPQSPSPHKTWGPTRNARIRIGLVEPGLLP